MTVELTDEQLDVCIADGISLYSKYSYYPERYLLLNLKYYEPGKGIDLHEFKVMSVKHIPSINTVIGFIFSPLLL